MADREQKLSEHYRLGDFLVDETFPDLAFALDPDDATRANLERLSGVIEAIVKAFEVKWTVRSGYRDKTLNEACRAAGMPASVDSLHLSGCAADIEPAADVDIEAVFEWIGEKARGEIAIHEAVYYPLKGFIHVAVEDPERPTAKRILMRT